MYNFFEELYDKINLIKIINYNLFNNRWKVKIYAKSNKYHI